MTTLDPSTPIHQLHRNQTVISPDRETVASFDREGRLITYFRAGRTFKRSLGSELHLRYRDGQRQRVQLALAEAHAVLEEVYALMLEVARTAPQEVRERLEAEVLPWTPERLMREAERFRRAYHWPISILPPDAYLSLVVQATFGCTWNRCTFCNFYQDRPFQARSTEDFGAHLKAVRDLLGAGLRLRHGVFLADGNALALSRTRLKPMLEAVREAFPHQPISSFIDVYSGERHDSLQWSELRSLGLERIHIGLETGLDELLAFINKPGSSMEARRFVHQLKPAGLHVSLIVMVGVGGREYREHHRRATLETVARMPLGAGDLVYLSPFVEHAASLYAERRAQAGLTPMTQAEVEAELSEFARAIRATGIRAARYDIREFLY